MSVQVRCQRCRVVRLDVFSEVFEVVWSGWIWAKKCCYCDDKLEVEMSMDERGDLYVYEEAICIRC